MILNRWTSGRRSGSTFALETVKALALVLLIWTVPACAAQGRLDAPAKALLIKVDWQDPQSLPQRFRNHCSSDAASGRSYCSNHCGSGYQFYYCSRTSFGCCRVGIGYCDRDGLLRCHP